MKETLSEARGYPRAKTIPDRQVETGRGIAKTSRPARARKHYLESLILMGITTTITTKKVAAGVVAIAMILGLLVAVTPRADAAPLTEAQIQSILSLLSSFGADQTTINNVNSSLRGQATSGTTPSGTGYTFTRNLRQGDTGEDVKQLQMLLNRSADTQVAASGAGSPGNETTFFGPATRAAVVKFQNKYASEVLAPVGLTAGTGFVGASTRAKLNALSGTATTPGTTTPGTTTPAPTGTGLTVSRPAQPADSLAPASAARIPFTRFTVTAGSDGAVVMNSVTVERTGLAVDSNFSGVVLVDENGTQIGIAKTLNSNHQATIGEAVTIPAGQSRTFTVAANRSSSGNSGEVASFDVVAINTSAAVSGVLPIRGASHTINTTLSIGSVTMARGSLDPGANQTKEVGTTGYTFSSIKITAGSAEDITLKSVRWNQTGSAGAGDLKNVKTVVDGTEYDTVLSADGKYYTTVFPGNGIVIAKGFNKDVSIRGDIEGGSDRTVDFDIAKRTDIYLVGNLYGYGITPPLASSAASADGAAFNNADDPYYDAAQVTISKGTMTVSVWTAVSAQNIAINQANQPLGGFSVDVKGESISVAQMVFNISTTTSVTNITLVDGNGAVLAGPVDSSGNTVTFTDTVTFPIGVTNLTLKGKLSTDWFNNGTFQASTTPSSDWTTVTGQVTGNSITPSPTSAVTALQMTAKSGALTISVSSVPIAQTVIAGAQQFEFARYIMDATASGEDVRVTTIPLYYDTTGTRTDLTNCQLYDGATSVTTGSNIKNPATSDTASSTSFTFDGTGLTIPKGTSKTLSLKCNVRTGVTSQYWWGLDGSATMTASGLTSGQSITPTLNDANGQVMTASSGGSLTVVLDANSPGYKIVAGGTTNVELARFKFSATSEDIDLKQVALFMTGGASNTPVDLVNREVKLYTTEGTLVSTAVFPTDDYATSSTISAGSFRIPKDGSKVLVVKGDIAAISASGPLTASGDLLTVDYDGDNEGVNGNYGIGVASGANVTPASDRTSSSGVRIMKAYPVLAKVALPSNTLQTGADKVLYRFKVTAVNGDVALYKFTFDVGSSTVSATTSTFGLYSFTDPAYSNADTTFSSTGILNGSNGFIGDDGTTGTISGALVEVYMDKTGPNSATTTYLIGSGQTRYLELRATVSSVETGTGSETISVSLSGDAAFPTNCANLMCSTTEVEGDTHDDFIWSPISTTTQNTIGDLDFTNGYQVEGLPGTNMTAESLTSTN